MLLSVTLTVAVPLMPWEVAVMVAVPIATPVTEPPGEVTVEMLVAELDQPTEFPLICFWLPSEYVAVAASEAIWPTPRVTEAGWTNIELMEGLMKKPLQDVRNGASAKPTATVSNSLQRSLVGRCPPVPGEDSARRSTNELSVSAKPISTPDEISRLAPASHAPTGWPS
jgi:hypothetical protein